MSEHPVKWEENLPDNFEDPRCITEFKWEIKNFSTLPQQVDTFYESPDFSSSKPFSWCLIFFPNGENHYSTKGWLGLYLKTSSSRSCTVDFVIGVEKVGGTKEFRKGMHTDFHKLDAKGWRKFLQKDELMARKSEFLPSDTLTIWICMKHEPEDFRYFGPVPEKIGTIKIGGFWKEGFETAGFPMLSDSRQKIYFDKENCDSSTCGECEKPICKDRPEASTLHMVSKQRAVSEILHGEEDLDGKLKYLNKKVEETSTREN